MKIPKSVSLDDFFVPYFQDCYFSKLWKVVKMVLILSHGQASVERGFSVNKLIEVENLKESSYISQRIIYDFIRFSGDVIDIQITKEMHLAASSARSKYMSYLEQQKASHNHLKIKRKNSEEIEYLKKKKTFLLNEITDYDKKADSLAEKAETKKDIGLFIEANELRKSIKEKKKDINEIELEISKLSDQQK